MEQVQNASDRQAELPANGDPADLRGFLHDSVGTLRRLHENYGRIVGFSKGQGCSIFAFGPDFNREVLTKGEVFYLSSGMPGPRNSAQRRFGHGLFGLNGQKHRQHRRLLMPPFRQEAVESYRDFLVDQTAAFLRGWQVGQVVDIAAEMKELALRITSKLLFGLDDLEIAHQIEVVFEEWMELNHETYFATWLPIDSGAVRYDQMLDVAERLEVEIRTLIRQTRAGCGEGSAVLPILLEARDAGVLSEAEVIGHLQTLFNAAYHTTTSALTWTVLLLAQHPAVMRELLDELDDGLGGEAPTVARLEKLSLLDRVIKESLRILPPVVYAPRVSMEPATLGSYRLPKGTMVVTSHYVTHHMPELFPQPERFLPDRWLTSSPSPYAYLPFGAGPRMCVGAPFSTLMLKICVTMIFQQFRLTVVPGSRIDRQSTLTLGAKNGIPMTLWRQDRRFTASPVEGDIHDMVHFPSVDGRAAAAG